MPLLPLPHGALYYEVHGLPPGSAPAIVFAHGAGGSHLSWWQQVPAFVADYTVITFDHRGYGQSEDPDGLGGAAYVDDLEALLQHLGVDEVNLVAQSMGGWTCLGFTLRHPGRVRRLVMADTHGGLVSPETQSAFAAGGRPPILPPGVHPAAGARMAEEQPALAFLYSQLDALNRTRTRDELLAILSAVGSPPAESVRGLQVPTLFIAGGEDIVIPPGVVEAASRHFPNAGFELVPEAGHSVYFERPERFNELVAAFLA